MSKVALTVMAQERTIVLGAILQQQSSVEQAKARVKESFIKADEQFREIEPILETANDRSSIASLQDQFHAVQRAHDEVLQNLDKQQFDQVQKVFDERVLPKLLLSSADAERLVQVESDYLSNVVEQYRSDAAVTWWILMGGAAVMLIAAIPVFGIVKGINQQLRKVAGQMADGAEQVAVAAAEVLSASQSLAKGASDQAASLEETGASSMEITAMTKQNAENSARVAALMANVDQCVEEADRSLAETVLSMRDIAASSDHISKIIKTIDEIAFQTNILALNAAVEAARAGDAGMGFAVVADEVRNLAQRCGQAAHDTTILIQESISKSNGGAAKINRMESAIQAITSSANQVRSLVDEVSRGSQEQARGMQDIARSISRIESTTQTTAASAEESASASEKLTAQASNMESLVLELRLMVDGDVSSEERAMRADFGQVELVSH